MLLRTKMMKIEMKTKIQMAVFTALICQAALFGTILETYGCASEARMFVVTKEQSGSEIKVRPGDIIQVELPALGSAGYSWHIGQMDGERLEFVSQSTRQVSDDGRVGAPVVGIWKFKARKQGTTGIKMDLYRKWEGAGKSVDHFSLRVIISEERGNGHE
jgi:predicted secreted protein